MGSQFSFGFWKMSVKFKIRDMLYPRAHIIKEVGIKSGWNVLDFGCGPGGYILPVSKIVGDSGKVYALDINPLAINMVKRLADNKKLNNVFTIQSDRNTGLPDQSIDSVLLYDVFHGLNNPEPVLNELHRVLKSGGILSFSDHHMKENEIMQAFNGSRYFVFQRKGKKTYTFINR